MSKSRDRAVVTIWFVSAPDAHSLLATNPESDYRYAQRLAKGLFPDKPLTPLGSFPLTRSVPAGQEEIYVGTYPGVTVVQTAAIPVTTMSQLVPKWVQPEAATHVYAFADGRNGEFAGFAHWHEGRLVRAFTATATNIEETIGLPDPAEGPYWSGEFPNHNTPEFEDPFAIPLPFLPGDILLTMYTKWMGFSPSAEHLELNVDGFALDGRPETKPMDRIVPPDHEDFAPSQPRKLGKGIDADELTAAEIEEASGEVVDDDDAAAAEVEQEKKPGLWTRFKRWWFGDKMEDEDPDYESEYEDAYEEEHGHRELASDMLHADDDEEYPSV